LNPDVSHVRFGLGCVIMLLHKLDRPRPTGNTIANRYGQSWDVPNLFVIGSSTYPSMSGFNPTLTIQALAYMSADAIVNRYKKNPGSLL
jgi:choline dehydrogenase-like flavoprotein